MNTPAEQPNQLPPETLARVRELQALITDFQRRADKSEDEDIREALNLQVSKLGLMVSRLRRGQSEQLPSEVEAAIEEELEPLPKPTTAQLEEADKLIQRAMLEKRRGNRDAAGDLLRKAVEVAPGSALVIEALGDDLLERKHYGAAREAFKAAHKADPKSASVERKLAQLSMTGMADLSIEDQLRMGSLDSPFIQQGEALASPRAAALMSFLIPGVGQLVLGKPKKGIVIFCICLVSAVLFALLAQNKGHKAIPAIAYFPACLYVVTWIAGVADCLPGKSEPGPRGPGKPDRPVPPVNLPFE